MKWFTFVDLGHFFLSFFFWIQNFIDLDSNLKFFWIFCYLSEIIGYILQRNLIMSKIAPKREVEFLLDVSLVQKIISKKCNILVQKSSITGEDESFGNRIIFHHKKLHNFLDLIASFHNKIRYFFCQGEIFNTSPPPVFRTSPA